MKQPGQSTFFSEFPLGPFTLSQIISFANNKHFHCLFEVNIFQIQSWVGGSRGGQSICVVFFFLIKVSILFGVLVLVTELEHKCPRGVPVTAEIQPE